MEMLELGPFTLDNFHFPGGGRKVLNSKGVEQKTLGAALLPSLGIGRAEAYDGFPLLCAGLGNDVTAVKC